MVEEIIAFGDIETEKYKSHYFKDPDFSEDADIDNALVSNKIFSGEKNYKCFICYLYDGQAITYNVPKNECVCKKLWWENK